MLDNTQDYNNWRRDVSCEYVLLTGRAFPKRREKLTLRLVQLSDEEITPNPTETIALLQKEGLLHG